MANPVQSYEALKRKGIYIVKKILENGSPRMNISNIAGQDQTELPLNSGKIANFRRFERLPKGSILPEVSNNLGTNVASGYVPVNTTTYEVALVKVGSHTMISKETINFAEDKVDSKIVSLMIDQFMETIEDIEFGVLKTGPSQFYAGKEESIAETAKPLDLADIRRVTNFFDRNDAKHIEEVTKASTTAFGTEATKPAYFVLCHSDLQSDWYDLPRFIGVEDYGLQKPLPNEIGQLEHSRVLTSNIYKRYSVADVNGVMLDVDGTGATVADGSVEVGNNGKAFIYPVVFCAQGAFNKVVPKGMGAVKVQIGGGDGVTLVSPYDDTILMSWNTYHAICITNEKWIATLNVARKNF